MNSTIGRKTPWQSLLAGLLCLGLTSIVGAQERPKVGLALGGGGARGVAHIGVLAALEKLGIPVDYIAGTSMGAVVGGLYASGMSPQEIEASFRDADWRYLLSNSSPRQSEPFRSKQRDFDLDQNVELAVSRRGEVQLPQGLVAGRKLLVNLRELTLPVHGIQDFSRLPIPFRAIATNIETGEMVVLDHGSLAEAMRASMAVPGAFSPYEIDGQLLVDGGLTSNLPIETVKAMGADIVIAVDVAPVLLKAGQLDSVVSVTNQMLDIMIGQNRLAELQRLTSRDVHIRLEMPGASSADFVSSPRNIADGFAGTMSRADALRALAVRPERFQRYLAAQRRARPGRAQISFVEVEGASGPRRQDLKEPLPFQPGEPLEFSELENQLRQFEGMRDFEVADFRVVEREGEYGLRLETRPQSRGPNFLSFGADFAFATPGQADANVLLGWRMTQLNSLGGEWESILRIGDLTDVFSEWYQPLEPSRSFFLAPSIRYSSELIDALDANEDRRRFRLQSLEGQVDAGLRLGRFAEVRVGYAHGLSDIGDTLNLPRAISGTTERGLLRASATFDTLDRVTFPRHGWFARLEAEVSDGSLGGEDNYSRVQGEIYKPITWGPNTLVPRAVVGLRTSGGTLPYYDRFALGGFLNLSGYTRAELYDQNKAVAELIYYRELGKLPQVLGGGIFGGASLEAGNVWANASEIDLRDSIIAGSLFLGADTLIGSLSLGVGASGDGQTAVYLQLGPVLGRGRTDR
ncbi:MAG: patatin-like phospholipase family protein [Chthoniobacterales bacterium]|nr:patatin-like phospholipase family protein [Chthoniobacterales bacterium]